MKVYAYLIILIIATISGGGLIGFISGVAFIVFWEVTGSMGKPRRESQTLDEQYHQESYGEEPKTTIQKLEPCIDILCFQESNTASVHSFSHHDFHKGYPCIPYARLPFF